MNRLGSQRQLSIQDSTEVGVARRAGACLAADLDFSEVRAGQLALIITESATNILKHADGGEILLRTVYNGDRGGVEVLAIDAGPGIPDLERQMVDGQSSAGSYGVGLGAMQRLAQTIDIYTAPGSGCILWTLIWDDGIGPAEDDWQLGAVCLPMIGEESCGDDWYVREDSGLLTMLVTDGLGHGPLAADASRAASLAIKEAPLRPPGALMETVHTALKGTRGAAAAIAQFGSEQGEMVFAGIGNISASFFNDSKRRHLLSHNGIVGSNVRKIQEFREPWRNGNLCIAHSDGIGTRWNLDDYPGLERCHPALIAAVIYRDHSRRRDDVSIVAVREVSELL
ncbi:ATP-binding SpoIIE family protein phosphatase [Allohahella marinimesophila]|uniref:ATP-binding protein n=1 Tax=Allohahella marinimesophila TaxID=1054972 RepID=A0ABP7NSD4_9GAMM